jgi:hypothetical protein
MGLINSPIDRIRYPFAMGGSIDIDESVSVEERYVCIIDGEVISKGYGDSYLVCKSCHGKIYKKDLLLYCFVCPLCGFKVDAYGGYSEYRENMELFKKEIVNLINESSYRRVAKENNVSIDILKQWVKDHDLLDDIK